MDGGAAPGVDAGVVEAAAGLTATQALAAVGACMEYSVFQSSGTNLLPIDGETINAGNCGGCHNMGDGAFWASYGTVAGVDQSMLMFQKTQTMPYLAKWISPVINNGVFVDLQASNAIVNQSVTAASCVPSSANSNWCHPQYQLNPDLVTAIDTFVTDAITRWHAGTCSGPSTPTEAGAPESGHD